MDLDDESNNMARRFMERRQRSFNDIRSYEVCADMRVKESNAKKQRTVAEDYKDYDGSRKTKKQLLEHDQQRWDEIEALRYLFIPAHKNHKPGDLIWGTVSGMVVSEVPPMSECEKCRHYEKLKEPVIQEHKMRGTEIIFMHRCHRSAHNGGLMFKKLDNPFGACNLFKPKYGVCEGCDGKILTKTCIRRSCHNFE